MAANIRLVVDNYADHSVLSGVPAFSSTLPVENLQNISRARVARTTGVHDQKIYGQFNGSKTVNCMILGRHNLPVGALYSLKLYADSDLTNEVFSSGARSVTKAQEGYNSWTNLRSSIFEPQSNLEFWFNPVENVNSFEIYISINAGTLTNIYCNSGTIQVNDGTIQCNQVNLYSGEAPPDTVVRYFELGRLFIGNYIEPQYNFDQNHTLSWTESTNQYRTISGTLRSDVSLPTRRFDLSLGALDEHERPEFMKKIAANGKRRDIYISLFPEDIDLTKRRDYSGIVKFIKMPKVTEYTNNYYRSTYTLEEV